ncbi:RC-LH1 core complex protein PufX [Rhodobacteraceae bacterium HSP-20]|uniref:RC-LH1 core complex protein PufX n=1 Tax=Paragemmobacter amnigenus TaxID=2852097 RepID=A0ABS6IYB0_9RHOB|nr:RC-LH1 core complex protein PufX [Rhodobacter amnigenus]MBU9696493.1 RC-LH1 core complex protein PufX [Rhodobacter amnigenus]MBV4387720.1 RC-LH1 core complex protein PufX [Rhodobacter amnigenus]
MSDNYLQQKPGSALRSWALYQMMAGAGWAALFLLSIAAILFAVWGIGLLLPEESKQAPDPNAFLITTPAETQVA